MAGCAPISPAVTVNSEAVERTSDSSTIFHKAISGTNSTDPVWLEAVISDGTTTQTRHCWLPKATTAPTYDADGNLNVADRIDVVRSHHFEIG